MKKILPLAFVLISVVFIFIIFGMETINNDDSQNDKTIIVVDIPENIQAIIDKSCIMCHSEESKNVKAKLNISFDKVKTGEYSVGKLIGKMNDISKVMDDAAMPPEKFIEKNPEKAMNDKEIKLLKSWAVGIISKLSEE